MTKNQKPSVKQGLSEPQSEQKNNVPEDGVGSRLRAAREARGISQTALAEHSKAVDPDRKGVSRTVIVGYESGQFKPGAREIRILCEALLVTPNWLIYGSSFAGGTEQASMEAVRKNGLFAAMRLALAISVLKPHERNALSSLVLSMAGRELGDQKLSALFLLAGVVAEPGAVVLVEKMGIPADRLIDMNVTEILAEILERDGHGLQTSYGNTLSFPEDGEGPIAGDWLYQEPKK
jgi:transcriptional regulator with XRE-family HTH domain